MAIKSKMDLEKIGQNEGSLFLDDLRDLTELKFRVIGDIVSGYFYWQVFTKNDGSEGKRPVRSEVFPDDIINPSSQPWDGQPSKPNQFLAMAIYDFADQKIKIWQVTKKAVMKGLIEIELDDDFGEVQDYDFKIKKTGVKMDTEYSLMRLERTELTKEMIELHEEANVNLDDYMNGTGGIGEKKDKPFDLSSTPADADPADIAFEG